MACFQAHPGLVLHRDASSSPIAILCRGDIEQPVRGPLPAHTPLDLTPRNMIPRTAQQRGWYPSQGLQCEVMNYNFLQSSLHKPEAQFCFKATVLTRTAQTTCYQLIPGTKPCPGLLHATLPARDTPTYLLKALWSSPQTDSTLSISVLTPFGKKTELFQKRLPTLSMLNQSLHEVSAIINVHRSSTGFLLLPLCH